MAISELSLEREDRDGVQIVHVRGPLDSLSHDQFKEYMDELAGQPHPNIVLDCEHLSYINGPLSAGPVVELGLFWDCGPECAADEID